MAVVGLGFAVLQSGKLRLKGLVAWLAWAGVHILSLALPGLRLAVALQWIWLLATGQRGSRVIVGVRSETKDAGAASSQRAVPEPVVRAAL